MDLLAEAREELVRKSRGLIEEETAWRWAARAVAAWERFAASGSPSASLLLDAAHYLEEATEHAALADPSGQLLRRVREWVDERVPPGTI